jgi:hypothetical protein
MRDHEGVGEVPLADELQFSERGQPVEKTSGQLVDVDRQLGETRHGCAIKQALAARYQVRRLECCGGA